MKPQGPGQDGKPGGGKPAFGGGGGGGGGPGGGAAKGRFLSGLIVGLVLGLLIALGVALYVSKVPVPFVDKVPQRSDAADAKEAASFKDWNPNANLPGAGKPAGRAVAASGVVGANPTPGEAPQSPPAAAPVPAPQIVTPPGATKAEGPAETKPASGKPDAKPADPKATDPKSADAGYVFFVQAGAFSQAADAEQQRARLAMQGLNAKVYERATGERTVYRVRIGPFEQRTEAEALQAQVTAGGVEATVARVQR